MNNDNKGGSWKNNDNTDDGNQDDYPLSIRSTIMNRATQYDNMEYAVLNSSQIQVDPALTCLKRARHIRNHK